MPGLKIHNFGGMLPAVDDRLLPNEHAALAQNTWLYSGAIIGMVTPTALKTLAGGVNTLKAYRIPNNQYDAAHMSDSTWLEFQDPDTDVIRAPVVGDSYERYYWVSANQQASYNTKARIIAGSPSFLLGVPTPTAAPTTTAASGVSSLTEVRSYVVTYLSAYGEESAPSPPSISLTCKLDDTVTVTLPVPGAGDTTNRNLTTKNIYRTVYSAAGTASFFFVANVALATTTYSDTTLSTALTGNIILPSTSWTPPPSDLVGWVSMPNGIIAGWRKNEIWFAAPYRPHAWPAAYTLAVDYPIIGLGVVGQTLIVCTTANPFMITGTRPDSMTQSQLKAYEPCTSRGSIISSPEGVYYSSPNGLVLVSSGQVQNITLNLLSRDRWQQVAPLPSLRAARLGTAYYAFGSRRSGMFEPTAFQTTAFEQQDYTGSYQGVLIESPSNPRVALTVLNNLNPVSSINNDPWTGEVYAIRNGVLSWINTADPNPTYESYIWRSKLIQFTDRKNMAAARVFFDVPTTTPTQNPIRNTAPVQTLATDQWALVRFYADKRLVKTFELRKNGEMIRIPSGFIADFWQIEIEGRVRVYSVEAATSIHELAAL